MSKVLAPKGQGGRLRAIFRTPRPPEASKQLGLWRAIPPVSNTACYTMRRVGGRAFDRSPAARAPRINNAETGRRQNHGQLQSRCRPARHLPSLAGYHQGAAGHHTACLLSGSFETSAFCSNHKKADDRSVKSGVSGRGNSAACNRPGPFPCQPYSASRNSRSRLR